MSLPVAVPDLTAELRKLLAQIPAGRVATYGDLADALGSRRAARWVGEFLARHPHGPACGCHRVVRVNGEPGLFVAGDPSDKLDLLRRERVPVDSVAERVRLDECRFDRFESSRPLRELLAWQHGLRERVASVPPLRREPRWIAGLDVSYRAGRAVAACVLLDARSLETVWQDTAEVDITFPYIPGFLAFRELPALLRVWDRVASAPRRPQLAMIDGNGRLHPRRAGIATQFGLAAGVPAIGVSKKLLCGRVEPGPVRPDCPRPVRDDDELLGLAVAGQPEARPVFVSPGCGLEPARAAAIAQSLFAGHRLPEPTFRADRLSRQAARWL